MQTLLQPLQTDINSNSKDSEININYHSLKKYFEQMLTTMLNKHHSLIFCNIKGVMQRVNAIQNYKKSFEKILFEISKVINRAIRYFTIYWSITINEKMCCYILNLGILIDGFHLGFSSNLHRAIEYAIWSILKPLPLKYRHSTPTTSDNNKLIINKDDYNYKTAYNLCLNSLNYISRDSVKQNCILNKDYGFISNSIKIDKITYQKPNFR